jgi:NAD(P)-dependent dehydrogenase (short-subunit alcohol dehydrogenase family)
MDIRGKRVVITGGASGIGRAMALRFAAEGAAHVCVADLQADAVRDVAKEVDGTGIACDVSSEADVQNLVAQARKAMGQVDVFCSNAGIAVLGDENESDAMWQKNWDIHVMGHVYAARALVPEMTARGEGYLVNTASAAGLLSHVNSATYTVTKHAAVAFAEWLSINYGKQGVRVSVLCPQAVRTAMTVGREGGVASVDGMMEPEVLAECVVQTMAKESFLILPHPEVLDYMQRKVGDYDRWLGGMQRLKGKYDGTV